MPINVEILHSVRPGEASYKDGDIVSWQLPGVELTAQQMTDWYNGIAPPDSVKNGMGANRYADIKAVAEAWAYLMDPALDLQATADLRYPRIPDADQRVAVLQKEITGIVALADEYKTDGMDSNWGPGDLRHCHIAIMAVEMSDLQDMFHRIPDPSISPPYKNKWSKYRSHRIPYETLVSAGSLGKITDKSVKVKPARKQLPWLPTVIERTDVFVGPTVEE